MAREIDDKKTKKALRKLRKAKTRAESPDGPGLTQWEKEFFDGVEERLETFGSAFSDPEKGNLDEALSARQRTIVREIDKKSQKKDSASKEGGTRYSSFKQKKSENLKSKQKAFIPRVRDIHEDLIENMTPPPPPREKPTLELASVKRASELLPPPSPMSAPDNKAKQNDKPTKSPFRIIQGGKKD